MAAGVAGPVAAMFDFYSFSAVPQATLLPLTIFARIAAESHDFWQLVSGTAMSVSITLIILFMYGLDIFGQMQ